VPTGLEQRVGRAARPGAARGWVDTYIPYIRGGGVEHIVSVLSPRGAEHHQVFDSFDGVLANESTIAGQLGEIASQVAEDKKDAGYAVTAARLKVAASLNVLPSEQRGDVPFECLRWQAGPMSGESRPACFPNRA
jgi:hypothetical protein